MKFYDKNVFNDKNIIAVHILKGMGLNKLKILNENEIVFDPIESERFKDALVHFQQAISNSLPYI